jgi:hypothetical protein
MRYSAFEQAAAEATIGVREIENQLGQLKSQLDQLTAKRDLLETLSHQLLTLRPNGADASSHEAPRETAAEPPAPEPAPPAYGAADAESEMSATYTPPRSLRESGWFTPSRAGGDSGIRKLL